jgi:3-methyl-2-oxobutanoate hydroxymethyltransferase
MSQPLSVLDFSSRKKQKEKISMVTGYTHWEAKIINQTDVDCILVGDSLAMVIYGHPTTLPATVEMMSVHTAAVVKGAPQKMVIADMPFLSFRKGIKVAMDAAEKLMQAGAHALKLEGVDGHEDVIQQIVQSGIPVMGHIGLTPQSFHGLGGFKVQGQTEHQRTVLLKQGKKLQELGAYSVVLECVPSSLALEITQSLEIPTIGIGAGKDCDGQVLVLQDLLGMSHEFKPRFVRHFMNGETALIEALSTFNSAVKSLEFPTAEESYK